MVRLDLVHGLHVVKQVPNSGIDIGEAGREFRHTQFCVNVCLAFGSREGMPVHRNLENVNQVIEAFIVAYHAFRYSFGLPEHVPGLEPRSNAKVLVLFTVSVIFKFLLPTARTCVYSLPSACIGKADDNTASSKNENNVFEITILVPVYRIQITSSSVLNIKYRK